MIAKYLQYRNITAADGVRPLSIGEWALGRLAGNLLVRLAIMAKKRGDHDSVNHTLLALWAGNRSEGGHLAADLTPLELKRAIKEGRLRLVLDK